MEMYKNKLMKENKQKWKYESKQINKVFENKLI
jgi:hypothetical protein